MDFGQILQVALSLAIVGLALWLAAKYARKNMAALRHDSQTRIVSRHGISRTQNLVEVEANGRRHLVALSDGGAELIDSWVAPEPTPNDAEEGAEGSAVQPQPFSSMLDKALAGTQWRGLGSKAKDNKTQEAGESQE